MVSGEKQIRIDYSDGSPGLTPDILSRDFAQGTIFDFFRILTEDDAKYVRWMTTLGALLKSQTSLKDDENKYVLAGLPENYILVEHNKWQGEGRKYRTDTYLFGHPHGKFRSLNEFIPHFLWLAKDGDHLPTNCVCKLCPGSRSGGILQRNLLERAKYTFTGMSEMGMAQLSQAQDQMRRDLDPCAPCYRFGEIVLHHKRYRVVVGSSPVPQTTDIAKAADQHRYSLIDIEPPYQRLEEVHHSVIAPYLSHADAANRNLPIASSASPVAKYTISQPTLGSALPGPCYVAWYLGPEIIYSNDLVRVSLAEDPDSEEIMLLSHIVLDVSTKTIKVRGDVFELTLTNGHTATDSDIETTDERMIPKTIAEIARTLRKSAKFVNKPGFEFEIAMVHVHGRFYHPTYFAKKLHPVKATSVVRGRISTLPSDLVSKINQYFSSTTSSSLGLITD